MSKRNLIHTKKRSYLCKECDITFTDKKSLNEHSLLHTAKCFSCGACGETFTERAELDKHLDAIPEELYPCSTCDKAFETKEMLDKHFVSNHSKKFYSCDMCSEVFASQSSLSSHYHVHTGVKSFTCHVCKKAYLHKATLDRHLIIHTRKSPSANTIVSKAKSTMYDEEKPYKCAVCSETFVTSDNLNKHFHIHTNKESFPDNEAFTEETPFKSHIAIQARNLFSDNKLVGKGESAVKKRTLGCKFCGKFFPKTYNLNRHLHTIHAYELGFHCNETFTDEAQLNSHSLIHSSKSYVCNVCGMILANSQLLKEHSLIHNH